MTSKKSKVHIGKTISSARKKGHVINKEFFQKLAKKKK